MFMMKRGMAETRNLVEYVNAKVQENCCFTIRDLNIVPNVTENLDTCVQNLDIQKNHRMTSAREFLKKL